MFNSNLALRQIDTELKLLNSGQTRRSTGFTLVEASIILAVIIVLAALLFPTFSRVRENGRRAACSNNLKQLYSAIQQYVQDNDSHYPKQASWEFAVDPYIKDQQIFVCPSQKAHGEHHGHPSDYAFNATRFNFVSDLKAKGVNDSMVRLPTDFILLEDAGDADNGAPYRVLGFSDSCGLTLFGNKGASKGYSVLHSNGGNYLFGDGHVKWLYPENAHNAECKAGEFQPGFK